MKQGNIYYTDKDFTDLEVSTTFKYPCMLILKNAENEIEKITAYNEYGIKSIYDFSLSASKQFVTDSIATANVGSRSQQLSLSSVFIINQNGNANKIDVTAGQLYSQTLDKTWNVSALVSTIPDNDYRYVYAKASKTTSTASICLSKNQIPFDSDVNDYYFLVGVLHSVVDGVRILSLTVGTTTISGGLVRTGIISSLDGLTSFNLNTGEIKGKITFSSGSSGYENITDKPDLSSFEQTRDYVNSTLQTDLTDLKNRADGVIESWFYSHTPTLSNLPASNWVTTEERNAHIGDTFTNMQEFVDNVTTPDAGKAWRFVKNETTGVFSWSLIANSDSTKALIEAGKAKDTADAKRRVFVSQPYPPYNIGDLWVQGNGGDIMRCKFERLSGSYVATDFEKASKYTDDTAVNNLQIGGRNLFLDSKRERTYSNINPLRVATFDINTEYTISFDAKIVSGNPLFHVEFHGGIKAENFTLTNNYVRYYHTLNTNSEYGFLYFWLISSGEVSLKNIKVEKGNKATDWMPAPEDVQSAINAAQNTANTANQSVSSLNTYVDGAFKDGVIDSAEAKAIEKYINTVNTEYDNAISSYNVVYANSYLEGTPKTNLLNTKVTLAGAKDSLISAISTAIADGKTTVSEKAAVDAAYASYKSAFGSYSTALENANKAIQQKLDSLSTDKVNAIEVGGRNYVLDSERERVFSAMEIGKINGFTGGETITLSFEAKYVGVDVLSIQILNGGIMYGGTQLLRINVKSPNYTKYSQTITLPASLDNLRLVGWLGSNGTGTGYAKKFKVEKGNKATDWTPAPEDIQLQIDAESAKVINLEHKTDFLTGTTIEGNAIATGTLLVGNSDGTNAGITGLGSSSDGVYLWGGGTYQQMIQGLAKKEQRRNGIDIWRHPNGQIGFEIGIKDGRLIFNGYHSSGFKLFELDPNRGLVNVSYTQESWTETPFRKLNYSSSTYDESTIANEIKGFLTKRFQSDYMSPPPYGPDSEFVTTTTYTVLQNAVGYDYDNGTNPANASYESLKGMKANYNDRYTNIANGWYMSDIGDIHMESELNSYPPPTYTFTVYVYYYQDGKITQTKVVTITK